MDTIDIRINVTKWDISLGCPQDSTSCPIYRAVRRRIDKEYGIRVAPSHVLFRRFDEIIYTAQLPEKATNFIWDYDWSRGEKGAPFSFVLSIPFCTLYSKFPQQRKIL